MTGKELTQLNELQKEINITENALQSLKEIAEHDDHWISISWGNGSARAALLSAPDTLQTLVTIQESLEFKLDLLTEKFERA